MVTELVLAFLCAQERSLPPGSPQPFRKERLYRPDLPYRRNPGLYLKRALGTGGGKDTEEALASTLEELARAQEEDGSWSPSDGGSRLEVTCLATLSFLVAGYTVWDQEVLSRAPAWRFWSPGGGLGPPPPYHRTLRRAITFLWRQQLSTGFIGEEGGAHSYRDHALASKILFDLCGWGEDLLFRGPAERAIEALVTRPIPSSKDDPEGSAWASLALRSAAMSSLPFDRAILDSLAAGFRTFPDQIPRKRAVDLILWNHLRGWKRLPADFRSSSMSTDLPAEELRDWFWGSKALFEWGGGPWKRWNERMKPALVSLQSGNAESMAFRALTLETYYGEPWISGLK